jgi:hypothetical protein
MDIKFSTSALKAAHHQVAKLAIKRAGSQSRQGREYYHIECRSPLRCAAKICVANRHTILSKY